MKKDKVLFEKFCRKVLRRIAKKLGIKMKDVEFRKPTNFEMWDSINPDKD